MTSMLSELQREVGEWGDATFTQSTPRTIVAHLKREVEELFDYVDKWTIAAPGVQEEAADCFLLLLYLAYRGDFDLGYVAAVKFELNKGRKWGEPDAEGVVEHVRGAAS